MKKILAVLILIIFLTAGCIGGKKRYRIISDENDSLNKTNLTNETDLINTSNITSEINLTTEIIIPSNVSEELIEIKPEGKISADPTTISENLSYVNLYRTMIVREGKDYEDGEHTWVNNENITLTGNTMSFNNKTYELKNAVLNWNIRKNYEFIYRKNRNVDDWCEIERTVTGKGKIIGLKVISYTKDRINLTFSVPVESRLEDTCNTRHRLEVITLKYNVQLPISSLEGEEKLYNWGEKINNSTTKTVNEKTIEIDNRETLIPKERIPSWIFSWELEYFN